MLHFDDASVYIISSQTLQHASGTFSFSFPLPSISQKEDMFSNLVNLHESTAIWEDYTSNFQLHSSKKNNTSKLQALRLQHLLLENQQPLDPDNVHGIRAAASQQP